MLEKLENSAQMFMQGLMPLLTFKFKVRASELEVFLSRIQRFICKLVETNLVHGLQ